MGEKGWKSLPLPPFQMVVESLLCLKYMYHQPSSKLFLPSFIDVNIYYSWSLAFVKSFTVTPSGGSRTFVRHESWNLDMSLSAPHIPLHREQVNNPFRVTRTLSQFLFCYRDTCLYHSPMAPPMSLFREHLCLCLCDRVSNLSLLHFLCDFIQCSLRTDAFPWGTPMPASLIGPITTTLLYFSLWCPCLTVLLLSFFP